MPEYKEIETQAMLLVLSVRFGPESESVSRHLFYTAVLDNLVM